jgi:hypothetical protein
MELKFNPTNQPTLTVTDGYHKKEIVTNGLGRLDIDIEIGGVRNNRKLTPHKLFKTIAVTFSRTIV